MKFRNYIDFRKLEREYWKSNDEQLLRQAIEALGIDTTDIPVTIAGDRIDSYFEGRLLLPGETVSLLRIYGHISSLINSYQVETQFGSRLQIKHQGFEYELTTQQFDRFIGQQNELKVAQDAIDLIEIREFTREFDRLAESGLDWESSSRMAAILFRRKGERLPVVLKDRQKFLLERSKLFDELTLDQVFLIGAFIAHLIDIRLSDLIDEYHKKLSK